MYSTDYPHSVTLWPNSRELHPEAHRRPSRGRGAEGAGRERGATVRCLSRSPERAFALDDGRTVVPEPDVKAALRGARRERCRGASSARQRRSGRDRARHPLVLKAFGPGHRAQDRPRCGAPRRSRTTELAGAVEDMRARLGRARHHARRLPGRGAVRHRRRRRADRRRRAAGAVRARDRARPRRHAHRAARPRRACACSRSPSTTRARSSRRSRARPRSTGSVAARRWPAKHWSQLLIAIGGPDGLAARLGDELVELECNPVLVTADRCDRARRRGSCCAMHPSAAEPPPVDRLHPLVRAARGRGRRRVDDAERPSATASLAAYRALDWDDDLYALHPDADAVDGVPAFADVGDMPEPIDYLLVGVPAPRCADVIRATAGRVPFIHVISGGFEEVGADGAALSQGLLDAAREVKTRVVGPNCIGVYSSAGRQTFQLNVPREVGPVSVVSQSGGLAGDIIVGGHAPGYPLLEGAQRRELRRRDAGRGRRLVGRRSRDHGDRPLPRGRVGRGSPGRTRCTARAAASPSCCWWAGRARRARRRWRRTPARSRARRGCGRRSPRPPARRS